MRVSEQEGEEKEVMMMEEERFPNQEVLLRTKTFFTRSLTTVSNLLVACLGWGWDLCNTLAACSQRKRSGASCKPTCMRMRCVLVSV